MQLRAILNNMGKKENNVKSLLNENKVGIGTPNRLRQSYFVN
jgi:hypothetical protein